VLSDKFPNYSSTVLDNIDLDLEKQLNFFEKSEEKIEGLSSDGFKILKSLYGQYMKAIKDIKADESMDLQKKVFEKRKRTATHTTSSIKPIKQAPNNVKNVKEEDKEEEKTPKLIKKKKVSKIDVPIEIKDHLNDSGDLRLNGLASMTLDSCKKYYSFKMILFIYLDKIKHNRPKTQIQIESNGKEVLK